MQLHAHPARTPWRSLAATAFLLACSTGVRAHTDVGGGGGFLLGFLHPLAGLDHLLAMVAVGIWGAVLGAPLAWTLPVVFPLFMVAGGVLGIMGVALPGVEIGIALSVVLLGACIAAAWRAPVAVALALVAFFGVFHGHAHGTELPEAASPVAYAAGFVLSTGLLHLAGIALGLLHRMHRGRELVRAFGLGIGAAGVWILVG